MFGRKGKKKNGEGNGANGAAEAPKGKKRRLSPKLLFVILVVIAVGALAGLYFTGMFPFKKEGGGMVPLEKVTLAEPLLDFTNKRLPEIYERMAEINGEILLIEREIARIEEIEKAFPTQKKITAAEVKIWAKTQKGLEKALKTLEKNVELFYVAYRVNAEKGEKLMESKKEGLAKSADAVLEPAKKQTQRLKPKAEEASTFASIKNKILGFIPFIGKK